MRSQTFPLNDPISAPSWLDASFWLSSIVVCNFTHTSAFGHYALKNSCVPFVPQVRDLADAHEKVVCFENPWIGEDLIDVVSMLKSLPASIQIPARKHAARRA